MTPEQEARQEIDRQLEECGWIVQDYAAMNIAAGLGVAVREFPLKTGKADYLLYADCRAIGVVEAKPVGHGLTGVEIQSAKYTSGLPERLPHYHVPLPFAYESTGNVTQFTNSLDPEPRSREVFTFHRPEELLRQVRLPDQLRASLQKMPPLEVRGLWRVQIEAIQNLEKSLGENRPRALIQMATGSGKTVTACNFCYRLLRFARAKRILFLVDRNTLGRQAENEFQQFTSPYNNLQFTQEYPVQRLKGNSIDPASKIVITTIQRLYSILKGEPEYAEENEDKSLFESGYSRYKEPPPVEYNPLVPIEAFDFIVVDECHRSIYNIWRQVLEYFDAFLIGLTATPSLQTLGFFKGNLVQDYSHEKAVADGVNVGYDIYRIQTKISKEGAKLDQQPGFFVPRRDRRTRKKRLAELDEDLIYPASQLDRDVVNESQIRLVIQTFRDRLFSEIFPGRKEVPKTLVFAKTDLHAEDIVRVIREEFGKGNEFCQKITSQTTGVSPEVLLNQFRNSYHPRIAVTVDLIATGTDIKPLECLLFMRNINSASYFEQMKGRGCRVIGKDDMLAVTPDSAHKERYVVVDAVGVCESDKTASKPIDRKPSIPIEMLLQDAAKGIVDPDLVSALGARLARLQRGIIPEQSEEIQAEADGKTLGVLAAGLLNSLDPDETDRLAREKFEIPKEGEPSEEQLNEIERERMSAALKPFFNPKLRDTILRIKAALEQVIDELNPDELLQAGYNGQSKETAQSKLDDFRCFIEENKDKIEALKILYSQPYRSGLRYSHLKELAEKLKDPPLSLSAPERRLWKLYQTAEPDKVKGQGGDSLVDLIAIVRHTLNPEEPLLPVADLLEQRYRQWLDRQAASGIDFTPEQRRWLDAIKDHIAASLHIETEDFELAPFNQLGGLGRAHQLFGEHLTTILNELNESLAA